MTNFHVQRTKILFFNVCFRYKTAREKKLLKRTIFCDIFRSLLDEHFFLRTLRINDICGSTTLRPSDSVKIVLKPPT